MPKSYPQWCAFSKAKPKQPGFYKPEYTGTELSRIGVILGVLYLFAVTLRTTDVRLAPPPYDMLI